MGGHDSWHPGCSLAALESFRQVVYSSCPVTILPSRHKPGAVHPFAAATTAQLMFHSGIIVHQAFQMLLAQAASDQAGLLSEHEGGARQGCSIGRLERIIQPDKSSDVTVSVFFQSAGSGSAKTWTRKFERTTPICTLVSSLWILTFFHHPPQPLSFSKQHHG